MAETMVLFFISMISLCFSSPTTASNTTGFSLKLIHNDSPLSPLYQANLSDYKRFLKNIEISKSRASYFQRAGLKNNKVGMWIPVRYNQPYFTVELAIGDPAVTKTWMLDTAGDLTWINCQPGNPSHYDRRASSTYKKLSCNHRLARDPKFTCSRADGSIFKINYHFNVGYATGQRVSGIGSLERFTFQTSEGTPYTTPKLVFGCATSVEGVRGFTGIVAMSRQQLSFARQLGTLINSRFSYCLGRRQESSRMRFGDEAVIFHGQNVQSMPFMQHSDYVLKLNGISFNGHRLSSERHDQFPAGCLVDTGTPATHLPPATYDHVIGLVQIYFADLQIDPVHDTEYPYLLCYPLGHNIYYPDMTFHFEGADFHIPPENVFMWVGNNMCFSMLRHNGVGGGYSTILGVYQQQNVRMLYDLASNMLSFVPEEDCSNDG